MLVEARNMGSSKINTSPVIGTDVSVLLKRGLVFDLIDGLPEPSLPRAKREVVLLDKGNSAENPRAHLIRQRIPNRFIRPVTAYKMVLAMG
jgi:hypothetical protein